jgi:SRSO17 transposase
MPQGHQKEATKRELLDDCKIYPKDLMVSLKHLKSFCRPYLALLPREEMRRHGRECLRGLLSDLERKSVEPMAERCGEVGRSLQYFMGASPWDHRPLLKKLSEQVAQRIGEAEGIFVIDPSTFPKKGEHSVGVARQWCGRLGKVDNCQKGIFLGYVSDQGHTLVDERLYLPKTWTRRKSRRDECHIPKEVRYKSAHQLALEMIEEQGNQIPHRWVVADDEFGVVGWFRQALRRLGERYVLDIPSHILVRDLRAPAPPQKEGRHRPAKVPFVQARVWKEAVPPAQWKRFELRAGTKGPLVVWAASTRVHTRSEGKIAKDAEWLVITKTESTVPEYRYHLSNAAEDATLQVLVHVANSRHWVEDSFQRAKGETGLDHYEVRSWLGWHHHITLSLLALWFLALEQKRYNKNTPAMTVQQSAEAMGEILRDPHINLRRLAMKVTNRLRRSETARINHWRKYKRLPPVWSIARSMHVPYFAE